METKSHAGLFLPVACKLPQDKALTKWIQSHHTVVSSKPSSWKKAKERKGIEEWGGDSGSSNGTYNPKTVFMQRVVLNWHITPPHAPSSWQGSVPVVQPGKLVAISGVLAFVHTAKSSCSADTTKQNKTKPTKKKKIKLINQSINPTKWDDDDDDGDSILLLPAWSATTHSSIYHVFLWNQTDQKTFSHNPFSPDSICRIKIWSQRNSSCWCCCCRCCASRFSFPLLFYYKPIIIIIIMSETQEYLPSVLTVAWCCWRHDDDDVGAVAEGEVQDNPGNAEKSSKTKVARSIHPIFSLSFLQPPSSPPPPLSSSGMTMTMRKKKKKKKYWS